MTTKAYRLLGILQEYAPNAVAQQKCTNMYNDIFLNGANADRRDARWSRRRQLALGLGMRVMECVKS